RRRRRRAHTGSTHARRIMIIERRAGRRTTTLAAAALAALILLALLAPYVAPYGVDVIDLAHRRAAPSRQHLFGTDELGRDLLTRVLFGARVSLAVGFVSAAVSVLLGVAI